MDLLEEFNKLDLQKCFLGGLGLLFVYWLLFFNSGKALDAQIAAQRASQQKNQTAKQRVEKALADKQKFDAEVKSIQQNMKDFQRFFTPDGMDINILSARISKLAENHSLIINSQKPVVDRSSEFPTYKETAVEFAVEGPFHNVMEFIASLTSQDRAMDFSQMVFKSTVKGDYPLVELTTILVVYTANEPENTAGGG